jgi:hypothetical protein
MTAIDGWRRGIPARSAGDRASPLRRSFIASGPDGPGLAQSRPSGYAGRRRTAGSSVDLARLTPWEGLVQSQSPDFLSPEKLQLFVAGLSGLAPEEVRKAKVLYIRNAISEYQAMQAAFHGFGQAQGCMTIIPVFWPIMGAQKQVMAAQLQLSKDRIRNAIDVWRGDLKGERFQLDGEDITA